MNAMARYPNGLETRCGVEIRAVTGRRLQGHAVVFNTPAKVGGFTETVMPGAFRASLASGLDVLALVDHDTSKLLGRRKSGTLTLAEDARGLAFDLALPNTQLAADVLALAERGDLGGMSFGFKATDEAWPTATRREIRAADLYEISVVLAHPAYAQTTVAARSQSAAPAEAAARMRRLVMGTM